jgi:hypothetical protein
MIVEIPKGLAKKARQRGVRMVSAIKNRPNLHKIDLTKVQIVKVPWSGSSTDLIPWNTLVRWMQRKLQQGFITLGTREFIAIFCDERVNEWLAKEPPSSPWKYGQGGLIGFPGSLHQTLKSKRSTYNVAIWLPRSKEWHMRVFGNDDEKVRLPDWFAYLRIAIYPLKRARRSPSK